MRFKEEWLMPGAVVPVDAETTRLLVEEIKRLIGVIGGMALKQVPYVLVERDESGKTVISSIQPSEVLGHNGWGFPIKSEEKNK